MAAGLSWGPRGAPWADPAGPQVSEPRGGDFRRLDLAKPTEPQARGGDVSENARKTAGQGGATFPSALSPIPDVS
jgi:hypothetical protein